MLLADDYPIGCRTDKRLDGTGPAFQGRQVLGHGDGKSLGSSCFEFKVRTDANHENATSDPWAHIT